MVQWLKRPVIALATSLQLQQVYNLQFSYNLKLCKQENFSYQLMKLQKLFNIWSQRDLSLFGQKKNLALGVSTLCQNPKVRRTRATLLLCLRMWINIVVTDIDNYVHIRWANIYSGCSSSMRTYVPWYKITAAYYHWYWRWLGEVGGGGHKSWHHQWGGTIIKYYNALWGYHVNVAVSCPKSSDRPPQAINNDLSLTTGYTEATFMLFFATSVRKQQMVL